MTSPAARRECCEECGPKSWWWVQWRTHTLFGEEDSEWHLVRVRRWVPLCVWLVYPEGADLFRLDPWTLDAEGGLWRPIPYGSNRLVRKLPRSGVMSQSAVKPIDPEKWLAH